MTVLVTAANGKTGRHVVSALRSRPGAPAIRALSRSASEGAEGVETLTGDMREPHVLARAAEGIDAVIHYAPPMNPRETAMGTAMIDAAQAAGVRRFVYISVIHPEIDDLMNHKAKLAVEAHLINSRLAWTVLRPQHYMQNIDVMRAVAQGAVMQPYPVGTVLGHVDMRDLAEAVAKVTLEPGHDYATYDIASDEHLSVTRIAEVIAEQSGKPVKALALDPYAVVERIREHWGEPLTDYSVEAFHRLFGYYARRGIRGNAKVLTWLLGRAPASFDAYVARSLAGDAGPVGNAG